MVDIEVNDTDMRPVALHPDGPIDGVPVWSIVSGNGTLLLDITGLPPSALIDWDPTLPAGYQAFLVSDTLPETEDGPVDTVYEVMADIIKGAETKLLTERFTLHVFNRATSLGATVGGAVQKP